MSTTLGELADVVRSKNAGSAELTFDVVFTERATWEHVRDSGVLTAETIAGLYRVDVAEVTACLFFEPALAFKATIVRHGAQGSVGERDTFGAQQHAPLLDLTIPDRTEEMPLSTAVDDPDQLRATLSCFPGGVTAIAGLDAGGTPQGMAANSFTSVSLDPPLISVCMADSSSTWPRLRELGRLGVSVLAEGQDTVCRSLAAKTGDRFDGVAWRSTDAGAVLLDDAVAWMECSVHDELPAGDHAIVLLRIERMHGRPDMSPLVFHASHFNRLAEPGTAV